MTSPDLKPCPACGKAARLMGSSVECADVSVCHLIGPRDDPDGAKWNALPRHGTGKEMEELREALEACRLSIPDDSAHTLTVRMRRAIDAVLAAAPHVETSPSGEEFARLVDEMTDLRGERDEARNKAAAYENKIKNLVGVNTEALAKCHRQQQQITVLKDLVREFAREGGDGK